MVTYQVGAAATLLKDGRVLIVGGCLLPITNRCVGTKSVELFDPVTETFTFAGNMIVARLYPSVTLLPDGRVLIVDLINGLSNTGYAAEVYDPVSGALSVTGSMVPIPCCLTGSVLLPDGKALIFGTPNSEIYDPGTGAFTLGSAVGSLPVKFSHGGVMMLPDGRLLIADDKLSLYDATTDSPALLSQLPISGLDGEPAATLLTNGKILISGGYCAFTCKTSDGAYLFDPENGALQATGLLLTPVAGHTATLLPGGHVLINSGDGPNYDSNTACGTDAEEYNPSTGAFRYAGTELVTTNVGCYEVGTLLPDGRVFIIQQTRTASFPELYVPGLRAASAATLDGPITPESVASLFGSRLAATTVTGDPRSPSTTLGGISLLVRDSAGVERLASLFKISPTEIRFETPAGIAPGDVTLQLINSPVGHDPVAAQTANVAPGIFSFSDSILAGVSPILPSRFPTDATTGALTVYGTGIRNRSTLGNVSASIDGVNVKVEYAGPDPSGVPGLDQLRLILPPDFESRGLLPLVVTVDGIAANSISVSIPARREPTTGFPSRIPIR
jgi:uncharacterized protein (TIGR03437 family)